MQKIKPRICKSTAHDGYWHCYGYGASGHGASPKAAYRNWLVGFQGRDT